MEDELIKIRLKFEKFAKNSFYSIDRNEIGEYKNAATYNMWVGFWGAKVDSNELTGENTNWLNANK